MLLIALKISDSFYERPIILSDNSYCVKDLKQFISNHLKVPQDEFSFVGNIQPSQLLSSFPFNSKIEIKFINQSDDLNFQLPNNEIITVEKAAKSNYSTIVKSFEKNGLYFSDFYVAKALNFYVFGEKIPKDGYNFRGLPKCVNINVKIHDKTVIIYFDNKKFIFYENEYVENVIAALERVYSPLIFFNIKSTKLNLILTYKNAQLKPDDKYEVTSGFKCPFIGPQDTKCDIPLNCLSTFYHAKQLIKQIFNLNSSPNLDIIIYSGDTLIEDLSMRVFYFLGKTNFYFDIVNKPNSTPPAPTQQPPTTEDKPTPPSPTHLSAHPTTDRASGSKKSNDFNPIKSSITAVDDAKTSVHSKRKPIKFYKPKVTEIASSTAEHKTKADESLYMFIYDGNDKEFSFKKKSKLQSHISEIKSEFNIPEKVDIKMEKSSNGEEPTPIKDQNQPMETFNNCLITIYIKENKKTKDSDSFSILSSEFINKLQPQLTKARLLGKGGSSKVYKVNCIDENNNYDEKNKTFRALKILKKEIFKQSKTSENEKESKWSDDDDDKQEEEEKFEINIEIVKSFFQEYELLQNLDHPNIVKTFGFFFGDEKLGPCILLEYFRHNLSSIKKIDDKIYLIAIIHELASVMKFVHQNNIIHRDLKPSNILLDNSKHVKLCDFGIAKLISTETQTESQTKTAGIGTIGYMAPEIIQPGGKYDQKVDVFSFGIVVHYILSEGEIPAYRFEDAMKNKIIPMSKKINKISQELIRRCISYHPENRPDFNEIYDFLLKNELKMIDGIEDKAEFLHQHLKNH